MNIVQIAMEHAIDILYQKSVQNIFLTFFFTYSERPGEQKYMLIGCWKNSAPIEKVPVACMKKKLLVDIDFLNTNTSLSSERLRSLLTWKERKC